MLLALQPALAQWAWRDAGGRMVYSDQPPPPSVAAKDIVRQPAAGVTSAPPSAPEPAQDSAKAAAAAPAPARPQTPSVADREIESRRRQQQLAEAEKKAADEEARKAKLAEYCERLRGYLRSLEGNFRLARVNAAGEREYLDDATRASERERAQSELAQQCQ